ncbi:DUF2997 domain-containing protein [Haliangium sp.]|uniref:DUF2997 domain-containing protein n=1 Tax=Haliangium sp. TaxID=2663208 RepID=UPI003D09DFBB
MKEHRIVIEINGDGSIHADADGFSGDACLAELDHLLAELATTRREVERKPDAGPQRLSRSRAQRVGREKKSS